MKIEIELNVSNKEIYNFLIENFKQEYEINNIKENMKFKKDLITKMGKKVESEVCVVKLLENREYELKYTNYIGENSVIYSIDKLSDYKIKLIYKEEYKSNSTLYKYNSKLMEMFYSYFLKKKKIKVLKNLEKYLISKREEKEKDND